ncbi:hypothetical protein C8R47DRAFT_746369 [Mycena vitilis]|nr:hypothetical protein C8R47DRAFT_746369 [Mycena vitilis]
MSSQLLSNASSSHSSFVVSSSSSATSTPISSRASLSQATSFSRTSSSRAPFSSSVISFTPSRAHQPMSTSSTPHQSISTSPFSSDDLPSISTSISISTTSSANRIPSLAAIADAKSTPLSHRPGIIAAISASVVVAALFAVALVFFLYRRRRTRTRQMQAGSSTSSHPIMHEYSAEPDTTLRYWPTTPGSTASAGWPEDPARPIPLPPGLGQRHQSLSTMAGNCKAPHYTVRSHASMTDVYGFGQDVAWQEAHYEDPLPHPHPLTQNSAQIQPFAQPIIDVVPPTPGTGSMQQVDYHMPTAASAALLRSASSATASSMASEYSTASMVLPDPAVPPEGSVVLHDGTDDQHWLARPRPDSVPPFSRYTR